EIMRRCHWPRPRQGIVRRFGTGPRRPHFPHRPLIGVPSRLLAPNVIRDMTSNPMLSRNVRMRSLSTKSNGFPPSWSSVPTLGQIVQQERFAPLRKIIEPVALTPVNQLDDDLSAGLRQDALEVNKSTLRQMQAFLGA